MLRLIIAMGPTFVNEECVYSITACKQEYLAKYPDSQIQKTSLEAHIRDVVTDLFELAKRKSSRRPSVSEVIADL